MAQVELAVAEIGRSRPRPMARGPTVVKTKVNSARQVGVQTEEKKPHNDTSHR